MGTTKSKEEVIIAQAGNSGGVSAGVTYVGGVMGMIALAILIIGIIVYIVKIVSKRMVKKIRRNLSQELIDIRKSQERV